MLYSEVGLKSHQIKDAAEIYASAFERKYRHLIGNHQVIVEFLCRIINPDNAIAVSDENGELLGLAGFHFDKKSLLTVNLKFFTGQFGWWRGLKKYAIIKLFLGRKKDDKLQLIMDGIAVKEGHRGQGVGKAIFEKLREFVLSKYLNSIKLDVIDENPRAKKLYESIGFNSTRHIKIPKFLYEAAGVSGVTTMVWRLT